MSSHEEYSTLQDLLAHNPCELEDVEVSSSPIGEADNFDIV